MKSKLLLLILFLFTVHMSAQVDRSKQPKAGPAPKISLETPKEFKLKNGLTVMVFENHKIPRVAYSLRIDNDPILESEKAGTSYLLGAMLGNGTINISKDEFNERIDFLGASMNFSSQSAYARSLSKYTDEVLALFADAIKNPLLVEEEYNKEKDKLIEGLKTQEKSVDDIAERVGNALSFGTHHPYGEYVTEETVNNTSLTDIKKFYSKHFTPNNAYLIVIGDVNFKTIKKQVKALFKDWRASEENAKRIPAANKNADYTQINFVDVPHAVQSNISLTNNVNLEMSHPDFHAVLITNKILGGGFNSYLNMNLREEHGYTYGARSSIGTDKHISRFKTYVAVRNAVTDSAVVETLKEINRIKTEKVDAKDLTNAKAKYVGDFVLSMEKPSQIAQYALNVKTKNLPADFYKTYLEKINAVTAEDVMRVANTYFKPENARIIVVGKGSEVLENLEKTGIPISYFDKYAGPTNKPKFSKPIPAGVTAERILKDYIEAVGGEERVKKVSSVVIKMEGSISGQQITSTVSFKTPNKVSTIVDMMGMTVFKQSFNGETGYLMQMGNKQEMPSDMTDEMKRKKGYVDELYLMENNKVTLTGIEAIDGNDAYVLTVEDEEGKETKIYFDTQTKLKLQELKTIVAPTGQKVTQSTSFGDFKEVDGIVFPHLMTVPMGNQKIELKVTEVSVNTDIADETFEWKK